MLSRPTRISCASLSSAFCLALATPTFAGPPLTLKDTTGVPTVTANSSGISCSGSTCAVTAIDATEKYVARSSDGKDTDRMTLLPQ